MFSGSFHVFNTNEDDKESNWLKNFEKSTGKRLWWVYFSKVTRLECKPEVASVSL